MSLKINLAFSNNPRVQPLKEGVVKPEGIELNWLSVNAGEIFHSNVVDDKFGSRPIEWCKSTSSC